MSEVWNAGWIRTEPSQLILGHTPAWSKYMHNIPSMWSWHITVSFLWPYRGCGHASRMFILDQNFLYGFFLIPEFLLWASCPWPNHCCLTQVKHGEQKQKTHSCLSSSSSEARFLDLNGPHQNLQSHPAFQSLATVVLSVVKNGWTKLFLARNVSSKFRKGREILWT